MRRLRLLAPAFILFAAACASSGMGAGSGQSRSSRNVITAEELQTIDVPDAYTAIQRLRSTWLRPRSGGGSPIAVFVDGVRTGDVDMLRQISAITVRELRFISPSDATTRWGTGYTNGAIMVFTRR
jgi:hypothetical protein